MKTITDITPVQKKKEKVKLAAYCRVSSKSEDQLHSYATQIRYYADYIRQHAEYELVDIYADEGLTGTEMAKRDELARLLKDCKNGKVERIIVKSVSRFARNTEELLEMIRALKDVGVSVYFEEQGIDTNKLNAEMIVTFPGMVAQQESMAISGNLRWGIQKRMQEGVFICSNPPYGYKLVNGAMVVDQIEAEVVKKIFTLYLQGVGMHSIAALLREEKVPRRSGNCDWRMSNIQCILKNEKYIGDALLQKRFTTEVLPFRQKRNRGEKAKYYIENYNTPIIDKATYQKVQALMEARRGTQVTIREYVLSKKMRCPDCGCLFRRQVLRGKAYWNCSAVKSEVRRCKSRRVKEEMVYDAFTSMVYKLQAKREEILKPLIGELDAMQSRVGEKSARIREIDKDIADLTAKNLFITRLHTSGVLSASDYSSQTAELNDRVTELRRERKKMLDEDDDEMLLGELRLLNNEIRDFKGNGKFNLELFEQIVELIKVNDNTEVTFHLLGGIELKEKIKEKGRCKTV